MHLQAVQNNEMVLLSAFTSKMIDDECYYKKEGQPQRRSGFLQVTRIS